MAKKEENKQADPLMGEISTIRNILMGQQMVEYDSRFEEFQQQLDDQAKRTDTKLATMEKKTDAKLMAMDQKNDALFTALEEAINKRFQAVEKKLDDNVDALTKKIESTDRKSAHALGKMLVNMGNKLLER